MSGGTAAAPSTISASPPGASHSAMVGGSATVADRPTSLSLGFSRRTRAAARASRSPRFVVAKAWISSTISVSTVSSMRSASGQVSSRLRLSGVVSRMSGGFSRWRRLASELVSPVRVSTLSGRPASRMGTIRLRSTSAANAFNGET